VKKNCTRKEYAIKKRPRLGHGNYKTGGRGKKRTGEKSAGGGLTEEEKKNGLGSSRMAVPMPRTDKRE